MSRMTFSQLRDKDVINLCNASLIGYIGEIEFEPTTGQICSAVICKSNGVLGLGKEDRIVMPWTKIECIGEDAILVRIPVEELSDWQSPKCNRRKKRDSECK